MWPKENILTAFNVKDPIRTLNWIRKPTLMFILEMIFIVINRKFLVNLIEERSSKVYLCFKINSPSTPSSDGESGTRLDVPAGAESILHHLTSTRRPDRSRKEWSQNLMLDDLYDGETHSGVCLFLIFFINSWWLRTFLGGGDDDQWIQIKSASSNRTLKEKKLANFNLLTQVLISTKYLRSYRLFHGFRRAKFAFSSSILGS